MRYIRYMTESFLHLLLANHLYTQCGIVLATPALNSMFFLIYIDFELHSSTLNELI